MKLNTKVLLIVLITWGLMLLATYWGSQKVLVSSYLQLEQNQAVEHMNRVNRAIDGQLAILYYLLLTYAVWDDSYQFIIDKNQEYIDGNLTANALVTAKIQMELWFDPSGKLVYEVALNKDQTAVIPVPQDLVAAFKPGGPLNKMLYQPSLTSGTKGLAAIPEGLLFVVAHSITSSTGTSPPHGTLVMAKFFDETILDHIRNATKLNIELYQLPLDTKQTALQPIYQTLQKDINQLYIQQSKNTLYTYEFLKDINHQPIAIIKVTTPRNLYAAGTKTISDFNLAFIISYFIFSCLLFYLLKISIINRLAKMSKKISAIGKTNNFTLRVPEDGNDELHEVAAATNKMVAAIHKSNQQKDVLISQVNYELEMANIFSAKVELVETFLRNVINSMPSAIVITDDKLLILKLNGVAEKEIKFYTDDVRNQSIFTIFPYLETHKNKFLIALKTKKPQVIDKISFASKGITHYYHIVIYPFLQEGAYCLAVRIDDVTEETITENKLNQNAKLVSIGVLTAGVAHEINNPINFVSAAIKPLRHNLSEILALLKEYETLKTPENVIKQKNIIDQQATNKNLAYTIEEIQHLIDGIKDGAARTATIVTNLKTFSRLDENEMIKADIHQLIESTLNLLNYRYRNRIVIKKAFGFLPKVSCYIGKLNQVFMSILTNAIDAIPDKGTIIISTERTDDKVSIHIMDSGIGISDDDAKRIFDPFFTTKPIGKGTGLGLSIAMSIIRAHRGTIEVKSHLGQGSEFIITLPIEQD